MLWHSLLTKKLGWRHISLLNVVISKIFEEVLASISLIFVEKTYFKNTKKKEGHCSSLWVWFNLIYLTLKMQFLPYWNVANISYQAECLHNFCFKLCTMTRFSYGGWRKLYWKPHNYFSVVTVWIEIKSFWLWIFLFVKC